MPDPKSPSDAAAEIARLEAELESRAWEISPAMAQAQIDQLGKRAESAERQLAAVLAENHSLHEINTQIQRERAEARKALREISCAPCLYALLGEAVGPGLNCEGEPCGCPGCAARAALSLRAEPELTHTEDLDSCRKQAEQNPVTGGKPAPAMTDLMVSPESLEAWCEKNPPPAPAKACECGPDYRWWKDGICQRCGKPAGAKEASDG
jgi:hypothetical protein